MTPFAEPRRYTPGAGLLDGGLPGDRVARGAARQAFVELRASFLRTLEDLPGNDWLVAQVRRAEEPVDLWLLRAPVFRALAAGGSEMHARHLGLRRKIDSVFLDLDGAPSTRY